MVNQWQLLRLLELLDTQQECGKEQVGAFVERSVGVTGPVTDITLPV